jgi:hypothetical protein
MVILNGSLGKVSNEEWEKNKQEKHFLKFGFLLNPILFWEKNEVGNKISSMSNKDVNFFRRRKKGNWTLRSKKPF